MKKRRDSQDLEKLLDGCITAGFWAARIALGIFAVLVVVIIIYTAVDCQAYAHLPIVDVPARCARIFMGR